MYERISNLLSILEKSGKQYDVEKIKEAYAYAADLHEGQFRLSGEPYISHPVAVAEIVAEMGLDTDSICAALLHDTVEDCSDKTNTNIICQKFGSDVALLVDGLTKIVVVSVADKEEQHIENIRKMLLAMTKDIRVIFIKFCDRLHNLRTLGAKKEDRQRDIALETMYVYAPLAHRLGMQKIKQELENLSLSYLDPIGYKEISDSIRQKYGQSQDLIEKAKQMIEKRLSESNIRFTLEGRVKTVYSIYRKMYNQNKSLDEIYDFYALRIIVETELECYTVLGLIHEMFNSIPGRFKDYISTPKPNMYRSLHTTVIGHDGIPFEVQIRTYEMHQVAEYGIAAHWKYKSGETSKEDIDEKLRWISSLLEADDSTRDPDEFMRSFKTDIFHDETFVFTPKGDVISLPLGSTVIDFAYAIHSAVGNKMVGAKINGMIVPIDRVPQNGEIVEIITSNASKGPSRDWLKIVKTGEAKNKIRSWFKKEQRAENIELGKAEIDKELRRYGRPFTEAERLQIVENVSHRLGIQGADDLYNTIGFGGLSISRLTTRLRDEFDRVVPEIETEEKKPEEETVPVTPGKPHNLKSGSGVVIDGEYGCEVKFAKCCNPLPGDDIIGFVTRGYGISIHKTDCPKVVENRGKEEFSGRWVNAAWENALGTGSGDREMFEANLQIRVRNEMGVLAEITKALADMKVFVLSVSSTSKPGADTAILNLMVGCRSVEHFYSIVSKLKTVSAVESVGRGYGG